MSVSKWAWRESCDGDYCPGDCDYCRKAEEDEEEVLYSERPEGEDAEGIG